MAIANVGFDKLAATLEGTLLHPGDDGYTEATQLWNGMIKKRAGGHRPGQLPSRRRDDGQLRARQ